VVPAAAATVDVRDEPVRIAGAGVDHDHLGAGGPQLRGQEREVRALGIQRPHQCDGCHGPLRYR
jgi:hypothetical protein